MYCKCGCGAVTPIAKRNRYNLGHIKGEHINYLMGHKMRGITGIKHFNFKGNKAGYKALHLRVSQIRGIANHCGNIYCNSKSKYYEWANLTGKYEDINDYKSLCRSCHKKYDFSRRGGDVTA